MKLSKRVLALAESETLAVTAKAAAMRAAGIDVISFGAGEPDFDTPENVKEAAIKALREGQTKYPKPAAGIPAARQAVCTKLERENGLTYTPNQVIITTGGKMACTMVVHALINPGDEVIIPVPYWVSYPEFVRLAGGKPVFVRGDEERDFKITPEQLAAAITPRTRMLIFNSPSNPGGFTYTPDEVRALAAVTAGKDIAVLADEIYDRLVYGDQRPLSFAACSPEAYAQTLTLNGGSKTYAMTGWRVGYVAAPEPVIKALSKLQSQGTSGVCTFVQYGLIEALTGPQDEVERMRQAFAQRGAHIHQRLTAMPGVTCCPPTGAFYVFPNVSGTYARLGVTTSGEFTAKVLEETGVAVVPGGAFGSDQHVRLSFACGMEQIDEGMNRLEKLLKGAAATSRSAPPAEPASARR
ncbi:MAG TPA: pyridoxal phosphate-dependent aminotransferase [Phycisphaerae bacterium]|nr:pyridoxal phosphate-dependent aminotransferase [Phycisphaerales bacterium]HRX87155.1 pyridoxal phosphate-dependent aminotransferase [Phycisphaerae bacterium]